MDTPPGSRMEPPWDYAGDLGLGSPPPGAGGRGCFQSCLKIITGYIVTINVGLFFSFVTWVVFLWGEEMKNGGEL